MAPEVALSSRYNHKSEAYFFGLILWEMLSHARPYEGLPSEDFEQRVCRQGVRPHVNAAWHPLLQRLLHSTFAQDFASRPDLEIVVEDLQTIVAAVSFNPASAFAATTT